MSETAIQKQDQKPQQPSVIRELASWLKADPAKLASTLMNTAFKGASVDEFHALAIVSNQYKLNPFLKQIYAFPAQRGGIVPIVSIDGWASIVNSQRDFDGCEFEYDIGPNGKPISTTCKMYVKGRAHPVSVTEFYSECHRNTDPWNKMPSRMLRHKAFMQAARIAFSIGGIYDEDEAKDFTVVSKTPEGNDVVQPQRPNRLKALAAAVDAPEPQPEPQNTNGVIDVGLTAKQSPAEMDAESEYQPRNEDESASVNNGPANQDPDENEQAAIVFGESITTLEAGKKYLIGVSHKLGAELKAAMNATGISDYSKCNLDDMQRLCCDMKLAELRSKKQASLLPDPPAKTRVA